MCSSDLPSFAYGPLGGASIVDASHHNRCLPPLGGPCAFGHVMVLRGETWGDFGRVAPGEQLELGVQVRAGVGAGVGGPANRFGHGVGRLRLDPRSARTTARHLETTATRSIRNAGTGASSYNATLRGRVAE